MNETERLIKIMEEYKLNARNFAEQVGIQPATMSNLMKGRNKPSLEVLQKVLNTFRVISTDWLILGNGTMYRQKGQPQQLVLFDEKPEIPDQSEDFSQISNSQPITEKRNKKESSSQSSTNVSEKKVQKITIFYTDGTFEEICK